MRFTPSAIVLSMFAAVTASTALGANESSDPRAVELAVEGRAQLEAGETQAAIDSFEAALTVDPGYTQVYVDLGDAARSDGLQGKAIHYYREAQERDPENLAAISGEGEALLEKGAIDNARVNLARLEELCEGNCREAIELAAAIDRGVPEPTVLAAETVNSEDGVTQN